MEDFGGPMEDLSMTHGESRSHMGDLCSGTMEVSSSTIENFEKPMEDLNMAHGGHKSYIKDIGRPQ